MKCTAKNCGKEMSYSGFKRGDDGVLYDVYSCTNRLCPRYSKLVDIQRRDEK